MVVVFAYGCKAKAEIAGTWNGPQGQSFTFRDDKTFTEGTGIKQATGKWTLDDRRVVLNIETVGGKSFDENIEDYATKTGTHPPKGQVAKLKAQMSHVELALSDDSKSLTARSEDGKLATFTKDDGKS